MREGEVWSRLCPSVWKHTYVSQEKLVKRTTRVERHYFATAPTQKYISLLKQSLSSTLCDCTDSNIQRKINDGIVNSCTKYMLRQGHCIKEGWNTELASNLRKTLLYSYHKKDILLTEIYYVKAYQVWM